MTKGLLAGALSLCLGLVPGCGAKPSSETRDAGPGSTPRRVLFIGLDGADWTHLDPLIAAGKLPNLARLVSTGASGVLLTESPPLSPILWTTMLTGRSPLDHRVLDFTRFHPMTGAREPIGSDEREVPAVWNIVSDKGRRVAAFGVWATHPAEPVNGLLISDRFIAASAPLAGAVHPPEAAAWAEGVRGKATSETGVAAFRHLVPDATEADLRPAEATGGPWSHPFTGAFHLLGRTETVYRLATDWLAREPWDLGLVYFEGTDTIGHLTASRIAASKDEDEVRRLRLLVENYFVLVDGIVGELAAIAERAGAMLMIASDHGFAWERDRPAVSSADDTTASEWHREEGIFLIRGPGIAANNGHAARGGIAQVASTLLVLAGLPPATGMAPPLAEAGAAQPAADYAWAPRAEARDGAGEPDVATGSAEEIARLVALGYLSPVEARSSNKGKRDRPHGSRTAASLGNEAAILERRGDVVAAARLYAAAVEQEPESAAAKWNLSQFLFEQGREPERSDELLAQAFALEVSGGDRPVVERVRRLEESGEGARALHLLDRSLELRPRSIGPRLLRGQRRVSSGDCRGGESDFVELVRADPTSATGFGALGMARLCLGKVDGARAALARAVELAPEREELRAALARLDETSRR